MQQTVRQKLVELEQKHGAGMHSDAHRCKAYLSDALAGACRRDMTLLVAAVEEGVVADLETNRAQVPRTVLLNRAIQRLTENRGVATDLARWTVESWALALDLMSDSELSVPAQLPAPVAARPPPAAAAARPVAPAMVPAAAAGRAAPVVPAAAVAAPRVVAAKPSAAPRRTRPLARVAVACTLGVALWAGFRVGVPALRSRWSSVHTATPGESVLPGPRASAAGVCAPLASLPLARGYVPNEAPAWAKVSLEQSWFAGQSNLPVALDLDLGGGAALRMVLIPSGTFAMGSPDGEEGRDEDEGPSHVVRIPQPLYVGIHEVTRRQYGQVMRGRGDIGGPADQPMVGVTHEDAEEFCRKVTARIGARVRLPTEAEWEYACRAGADTAFAFGATISPAQANYDGSCAYGGGPTSVYDPRLMATGAFDPNAWGLYDMHGNAAEWVADWYAPGFYSVSGIEDPLGPPTGVCRVQRGGSFGSPPQGVRSANRVKQPPADSRPDLGFRVVCEAR